MRFQLKVVLISAVILQAAIPAAQAIAAIVPPDAPGGPVIRQDFNAPNAWPHLSAVVLPAALGIRASVLQSDAGTIDAADLTTPSGAIVLKVQLPAATSGKGAWGAAVLSGPLPVRTMESDLRKLTLSFDGSISATKPILVGIESFDSGKRRTGGLESRVYPAAPNFYQRFAIDLSTMKAVGGGSFRPGDPFVQVSFRIGKSAGDSVGEALTQELRIDNVEYASPAFYVSPKGNDANNGRTEGTAFANPQKAVDAARPGDIILLMDGTYQRPSTSTTQEGTIYFRHGGTPAAWIVVKNYPGHHPVLTSDSWNTIKIGLGSQQSPSSEPALAYIELRGLHVRGNALVAKERFADAIGKSDPSTNGNGISVDSRFETNVAHHIRIADNLVENCCGGGISALQADWITAENNVVRDNCWWMIYAGSGISFLTTANFDAADNIYKDLIRNNTVSGNRCFEHWIATGKASDGNGIIIDTNYEPKASRAHRGRTLVQNNVSFNNGGSGIHSFHSHRVDIVNNTAYWNGATPELNWGQIFVQVTDDARIMNNILVSRPGQPVNSIGPDGGDQDSTKIVRANNIYFGGLTPKLTGENDLFVDPMFAKPSIDATLADFHIQQGSPAVKSGTLNALVPLLDLDGEPRGAAPSRGAYQQ